jgi:hypothetical protein
MSRGNGAGRDDSHLDEDFPLGDATADLTGVVTCPYCGEQSEVAIDPGSGARQSYVEDCPVCCRPWNVYVVYGQDGAAHVHVSALDQ